MPSKAVYPAAVLDLSTGVLGLLFGNVRDARGQFCG